jgi:hypothetical protein
VDPITHGPVGPKKLPHFKDSPGTLITMAYNGEMRGLVRNISKGYLKNSLEIDISIREKNINMKMSENKFQMVGLKNLNQGWEVLEYITKHVTSIHEYLLKIQENKGYYSKQFDLIKKHIRGEDCKHPVYKNYSFTFFDDSLGNEKKPKRILKDMDSNVSIDVLERTTEKVLTHDFPSPSGSSQENDSEDVIESEDEEVATSRTVNMTKKEIMDLFATRTSVNVKRRHVTIHTEKLTGEYDDILINFEPLNADSGVDHMSYKFIRNAISNFKYYPDAIVIIDWILSLENGVYDDKPVISRLSKAMVNYNYDLGFMINRARLAALINRPGTGFRCSYDILVHHTVTIRMTPVPEEDEEEEVETGNKKKSKKDVKFMVYHSGKVTQSGPNEEINKKCYKKFVEFINSVYEEIVQYKPRKYVMKSVK